MGDNLEALRKGELDVVQMFEPYVSMALQAGAGDVLYAASQRGPTVYTTFLATRDSIRRNRAAFDAMVRATRRTLAWVAEHSAEELADAGRAFLPGRCRRDSLLPRFDAIAKRTCGPVRRKCHGRALFGLADSLRSGGFISRMHSV